VYCALARTSLAQAVEKPSSICRHPQQEGRLGQGVEVSSRHEDGVSALRSDRDRLPIVVDLFDEREQILATDTVRRRAETERVVRPPGPVWVWSANETSKSNNTIAEAFRRAAEPEGARCPGALSGQLGVDAVALPRYELCVLADGRPPPLTEILIVRAARMELSKACPRPETN
jgi:hypothetical protein